MLLLFGVGRQFAAYAWCVVEVASYDLAIFRVESGCLLEDLGGERGSTWIEDDFEGLWTRGTD